MLALAMVSLISISSPIALLGFTSVRAASEPADNPPTVYRLLQLNLLFDNRKPEKVFSLIGRTQPDVVTFNEVSEKWMVALGTQSAVYPYRLLCPPLAILSRRPFGPIASQRCYDEILAMVAINFGGHEVTVAAMHLGWPWPYGQFQQIDDVAPVLRTLPGTVILAGDLNAAGWSVAASRVAETGQLTLVPWVGPTWSYRSLPNWLRPWIGLPIDHVFFKGNVVIHSARVQEEAGSDHLPVLIEFSVITSSAGPCEKSGTVTRGRFGWDARTRACLSYSPTHDATRRVRDAAKNVYLIGFRGHVARVPFARGGFARLRCGPRPEDALPVSFGFVWFLLDLGTEKRGVKRTFGGAAKQPSCGHPRTFAAPRRAYADYSRINGVAKPAVLFRLPQAFQDRSQADDGRRRVQAFQWCAESHSDPPCGFVKLGRMQPSWLPKATSAAFSAYDGRKGKRKDDRNADKFQSSLYIIP